MAKRLLSINALLVVVAAALGAYVGWEIMRPAAPSAPSARRAASAPSQPAAATTESATPPANYGIIASRNLFSPTRSDAPAAAGGGATAIQIPKPNLYGIVLRDGAPIAYLEDPVTKRVAGYRVGDAVAGGTLKSIDADRVILTRPEGNVDVRLHDPSRPRALATPPQQPGALPQPLPGVMPPMPGQPQQPQFQSMPPMPLPQTQLQSPQAMPPSGQPAVQQPGLVPGRRPVPPNLIRRFQQNAPGDASAR